VHVSVEQVILARHVAPSTTNCGRHAPQDAEPPAVIHVRPCAAQVAASAAHVVAPLLATPLLDARLLLVDDGPALLARLLPPLAGAELLLPAGAEQVPDWQVNVAPNSATHSLLP